MIIRRPEQSFGQYLWQEKVDQVISWLKPDNFLRLGQCFPQAEYVCGGAANNNECASLLMVDLPQHSGVEINLILQQVCTSLSHCMTLLFQVGANLL